MVRTPTVNPQAVSQKQNQQIAKLPPQTQAAVKNTLAEKAAKEKSSRVRPADLARTQGSTKPSEVSKKPGRGDRPTLEALSKNPATAGIRTDLAKGQRLSQDQIDVLRNTASNPGASADVRNAANNALIANTKVNNTLNSIFNTKVTNVNVNNTNITNNTTVNNTTIVNNPVNINVVNNNVTRVDSGGVLLGVAAIISASSGLFVPPPMVVDPVCIYQPCVPVTIVDYAAPGVYYSVWDNYEPPVIPAEAALPVPPAPPAAFDPNQGYVSPTSYSYHTRYLYLGNNFKEKVTVHLQYYTQDQDGNWVWGPSETALDIELDPGTYGYAYDGDWQINASAVRIWAEAESGQTWEMHKEADFLLVPETDEQGNPVYVAEDMGTVKWVLN